MASEDGVESKPVANPEAPTKDEEEEELERLAVEALLQEAKRGRVRAEQAGTMGWQKCQLPKANKRFINSVVASAVSNNKRLKIDQHKPSTKTTPSMSRKKPMSISSQSKKRRKRSS